MRPARIFRGAAAAVLLLACAESEDPLESIRRPHHQSRDRPSLEELRRLVDEDPSRSEAQLFLGAALLRSGEPGLAVWPLHRASESPEHAVEAGLLLAEAMLEGRTAPDARAAADRVLGIEPDNINAVALRMQANLASGEHEAALADMDRLLELDPENLAVLVPRVTSLISLDRIEDAGAALAVARESVEASGDGLASDLRSRLCIAQGLFSFEKGERDAAEVQYARCLEQFPDDPLTVRETAAFYDRVGEHDTASGILRGALERTGLSAFRLALAQRAAASGDAVEQERLLRAEAEDRASPDAWFALADFYVDERRFAEALPIFETALAASPMPAPMLRFAYADTLVQAGEIAEARRVALQLEPLELQRLIRGRILLHEGDARGALAAFEEGIRLWPNNAVARFLAGSAAERIGDFDRAVSEYRESIRSARGRTPAGLALAPLHAAQEDWEGALDAARSYVAYRSRDPEAYLTAVRIAHQAGQPARVIEGLRRLEQLPGQAPVALAERAALLAQSPERAVDLIERASLDLTDPENLPALRVLVAKLLELGQRDRAESAVARALASHPQHAPFHSLHGLVLRESSTKRAQALEAFERALSLERHNTEALSGLARFYAEAGDGEAALRYYDEAAKIDREPIPALNAALLVRDAGDRAEAAARLERLLADHPREARVALELAELLADEGYFDRAEHFARRATWFGLPEADAALARIQLRNERSEPISER